MNYKMATIFSIVLCLGMIFSAHQVNGQVPQNNWETLGAGAPEILGQINDGFSCDGKGYGYYADTFNACNIFHVCRPIIDEHGVKIYKQWSFFCGNQTLFNQAKLICDHPDNVDCTLATNLYSINDQLFPKEDQPAGQVA